MRSTPLKDQPPHFFLISLLFFADKALGKRLKPNLTFTTIKKTFKKIYTPTSKRSSTLFNQETLHSFITL